MTSLTNPTPDDPGPRPDGLPDGLPPSVQRVWRAAAVASGLGTLIVGSIIDVAVRDGVDVPFPRFVVPAVLALLEVVISWWIADARYRSWRIELTDQWIGARWGVVIQRRAIVPRNRVQTVTSENGPLDRMLGLTTVVVHTAGAGAPNLRIPFMEHDTVEWLADELASRRPPTPDG
ncbi:MAG: PH domain-containing protein [Acidimicrobiales bacterium]